MTENNYPQMDFGAFRIAIADKAALLLKEVNEDNLKYFAEETKKIAESAMENYIFHVYDVYSDGARKISDVSKLARFTDYRSGFQGLMRKWIEEHPIVLKEQTIAIPSEPEAVDTPMSPGKVLTVGTAVAVGLFIFTNHWVALAAELLTLALTYRQVLARKKAENEYAARVADYERTLKKIKQDLLLGLTDELETWLISGKGASDAILKSYNL